MIRNFYKTKFNGYVKYKMRFDDVKCVVWVKEVNCKKFERLVI